MRTLPVDGGGAVVDEPTGADAVLLNPAHQFPLGVALQAQRRTHAVQWAADTGGVVIEYDYDGDRQPVGVMQALAPEQVVYAGTASKTLAPGLRLGWLVLPEQLLDDVAAAKVLADRQTAVLDQLTLAEFIASGGYDRQGRRCRLAYRRRRDRLVAALHRHAPQVGISGVAAGLHAVVELPSGWPEAEVVADAARKRLAVEGLGGYAAGPQSRGAALVVGYGSPPQHAFTGALARLCAVLGPAAGTA